MSMIEAVLAAVILLLIAVGILPMFTRSMASNASGADSTYVSNMATARAEEMLQLPFDAEPLTLAAGSTSRVFDEVYTEEDGTFIVGTEATAKSAGKRPLWTRVTTIRQFSISDLDTPIAGTASTSPDLSVHIKEIEVEVGGLRQNGPLGGSKNLAVRVLKSP